MKTLLIICTLLLTGIFTNAQPLTQQYLVKIPSLPKDTCNITKNNMEAYVQKIKALIDEVDGQITSINSNTDKAMKNSEETAQQNAMKQIQQQYGLSQEQMKQMQSGKMSAAEKQALANQVLQQQTNMSMGEVQNMSKMSEAGKKAYMEAYGTEMMATGQTTQNQQNEANAKNLNQIIAEQQALNTKVNETSSKISNLYTSIENDPELLKSYQNIEKWHSKLMSMSGVDAGQGRQMDSLGILITNEQIKICDNYTPRLRSAIKQHYPLMKASIPDAFRLAQVTAELTKSQSGVIVPPESFESGTLSLIKNYLEALSGAYTYKIYYPEDN
jgi:hypothetical protein